MRCDAILRMRTVTLDHSSGVGGGAAGAPSGRHGPACSRVRISSSCLKATWRAGLHHGSQKAL